MGTFDWNRDGKTDWQDDMVFNEVISKDSSSGNDDDGEFPTLGSSGRSYSSSKTTPQRTNSAPRRQSGPAIHIGGLTMLAIAVTIFLCISALLMGYGNIIGDLLGFGFLGCLFTSWLEKNP